MLILLLLYIPVTAVELLTIAFINKREPEISLKLKKYGIILAAGNLLLAGLSWYKETQSGIAAWWYFGLFTYLLCLTIYDLKFRELPDWWHLLLPLFYVAAWLCGEQPIDWLNSAVITIVYAAVFGLVVLLRRDALGIGDIKLLLLCGIYAGSASFGILIRGMILAFFFSIGLLLFKKANSKSELPFVPFLLLGALLI